MGIYKLVQDLKILAINTQTVSQASFGDIQLYDNKSNIKYPYVNFDIVNTRVVNNIANYNFRMYVCDRNDPYVAYNKTNLILNSILKHYSIDATNYVANFFTLNFQDLVNGCWVDFVLEDKLEYNCLNIASGFTIAQDMGVYELSNNLVNLALSTETVNGSAYGEISLYDNHSTIEYPYVNFDIVSSTVRNNSNIFKFKIMVMDRNEPYIAYNKTELILNNILKYYNLEINSYIISYFTLDYQDMINGCSADFNIETLAEFNCLIKELTANYIITEDGDYIVTEDTEQNIITE